MREEKPTYTYGEEVVLTRAKVFYRVDDRSRRTLPKGSVVQVDRPEALCDDHGHFGRFWYHLKYEFWWSAIAEEGDITKPGVLDRLSIIRGPE